MAERSAIEWTDSTFNPWIGCTHVSPACDHCYAEVSTPSRTRGVEWGVGKPRHRTSAANWKLPLKWNRIDESNQRAWDNVKSKFGLTDGGMVARGFIKPRRRRVFCASLADVFDNEVPAQWRADLFALIRATPNLDWLLLTKRIGNAVAMMNDAAGAVMNDFCGAPTWERSPWPNVWLGATICNQAEADRDVPKLLRVPAAVRFLSIEPMLGPVKLRWEWVSRGRPLGGGPICNLREPWKEPEPEPAVDWIIAGGESGLHARPPHPDGFRSLRDQCAAAGVPFLLKQWGEWLHESQFGACSQFSVTDDRQVHEWPDGTDSYRVGKKAAGRLLDGVTHDGYPKGGDHA